MSKKNYFQYFATLAILGTKVFISVFSILILLISCSDKTNNDNVIRFRFPTPQVGIDSAAEAIREVVNNFNIAYEGIYFVEIEEVPGVQNYIDQITLQIESGNLPPVVYGLGYNLLDLLLARNLAVDLTDFINADETWKSQFNKMSLVVNSRNDRIYASSSWATFVGYYYNKELFELAGIVTPAETWEEFEKHLESLKSIGIIPLSLQTMDSAWTAQFWLGALIATKSDNGLTFMQTPLIERYNHDFVIEAATILQRWLQEYTTVDAIGGDYAIAASNFLNERTAMIANGPWMISMFSDESMVAEGFYDKIGYALFPGNFVFDAPDQGYIVTKQGSFELEKAAIKFVRFISSDESQLISLLKSNLVPSSYNVVIPDEIKSTNPLLADCLEVRKRASSSSYNMQTNMAAATVDELGLTMTLLGSGDITPKVFAERLTKAAEKNNLLIAKE